jgi:apolipoprotein N-acyltransferase
LTSHHHPHVTGFFLNAAAILGGAVLFAASFPNPLFSYGLSFLAWIAYVPVFWVINRSSIAASVFWGALYGYAAYALFMPWLGAFHPMAGVIASVVQMCCMAALFPLLRLALLLYPRKGYIVQGLIWLAYEYLRTLGFMGFPYGIIGYTQWQYPALIGIASIFGVWGVSALVLFPSAYLAAGLPNLWGFFRKERLAAAAWLGALGACLCYGVFNLNDTGNNQSYTETINAATVKIALIQQNNDPWQEEDYSRTLQILTRLSQQALEAEPGTELVVWPETAFVPRIYWHLTYRDTDVSYRAVRELMDFLEGQKAPFLIGNDDARLEVGNTGDWDRADYNAALLFKQGELVETYRKMHLVPFTEYFPYEKAFPRVFKALTEADTHFWKPGKAPVLFYSGRYHPKHFPFSALICFEDCFGSISRENVRLGAEVLINLTNDAWAQSLSCQMQHLSMAVFRAVENRRSLVRAAASGQTCAIGPFGKVLAMAQPFTETFLNVEVPLGQGLTPYTVWGDIFGILYGMAAATLLLIGIIRYIMNQHDQGI